LDLIEEAKPVKPLLEEFIEGKDVTRLGDFVAALFKGISTCKDKQKVSEAITGVAPDLLTSLPQLFPDLFGATAPEGEAGPPATMRLASAAPHATESPSRAHASTARRPASISVESAFWAKAARSLISSSSVFLCHKAPNPLRRRTRPGAGESTQSRGGTAMIGRMSGGGLGGRRKMSGKKSCGRRKVNFAKVKAKARVRAKVKANGRGAIQLQALMPARSTRPLVIPWLLYQRSMPPM